MAGGKGEGVINRRITERIVAVLLILFLVSYVGYQAQRFFYSPVDTEAAQEHTISRTMNVQGIAIRDEIVLEQRATGAELYLQDDATRVALEEPVVELYQGKTGDSNLHTTRQLEEEIRGLRNAQDTPRNFASTEAQNKEIKSKLGLLSAMTSEGRFEDLTEFRQDLTININCKQISNGRQEDYSTRIQQLELKQQQLEQKTQTQTGAVVTAPMPGYFSRKTDGYETRFTPEDIAQMSAARCLRILETPPVASATGSVGKIVRSEKWIFLTAVPSYHLEWIKQGQEVKLQFEQVRNLVPVTISEIIQEQGDETAVLLLRCNMMNEELVNLREADAVIHFQTYTGIRINTADLRFLPDEDGVSQRGVYVLDDHVVRFKRVDPIYEEQDFLLSRTYSTDSTEKEHIRLFDQIITDYQTGADIYDGKTIQDY